MYVPFLSVKLPTVYLKDSTQRYYEICSILLPICTVAKPVKAMCKYSEIPHSGEHRIFSANLGKF